MKQKQNINITIDTDVYLKARLKDKLNLSGLINGFLKEYFEDENDREEELIKELDDIKNKKAILEYEITKRKNERERQAKEQQTREEQETLDLINSIPRGNDFHSRLIREKMLTKYPDLKKYIIQKEEESKK